MFDDIEAAQHQVDDWQARIEEQAAAARTLSRRLAALTATARSDDGLVSVTVASSGALKDLSLDEKVREQSAARTAAQILATARAAQVELARKATEATGETIGVDGETGHAIVRSYTSRLGAEADDGR